jgi:aminoglycoside phosphotransferase (APT) family kinase protein
MVAESRAQTHGRYHARHVFVAPDAVTVIDLDRVALADPAKDLGEFLHRLRAQSRRARLGDEAANRAAHAFLEGYATHTHAIPHGLVYYWSYSILSTLLRLLELKRSKWERRLEFYQAEFEAVPLRARSLSEHLVSG